MLACDEGSEAAPSPDVQETLQEGCDSLLVAAGQVVVEEVHEGDDDEFPPFPPPEYAYGDGNELHHTFSPSAENACRKVRRLVYHSLVVLPSDTEALLMDVECDQTEKDCTLAVCACDTAVKGSFAEFFTDGGVLKPIRAPGGVVRLCICPVHRLATVASPLMDAAKSIIQLPTAPNGWRVIAENGDSFVRFFHVGRSAACFCDFPVLFSA